MSHLALLKTATSLTDIATLVGFKPAALSFVLYKKPAPSNYKKFEIPKRYGGTRQISAPIDQLKLIQRRLATILQNCAEDISKANGFRDEIAHGFKRKRSIVTNAKRHRRRRYVFNVDLKDFFATINFGRVRGYFIKDRNFALNESAATVLAQIVCYENGLPQGSPCSPVVSNLIGHVLDIHLARLAATWGCTYTRYADDLTFSTNKRHFPEAIARKSASDPHVWLPGDDLVEIVRKSKFEINPSKTRMQYRDSRQTVTGIVVNERLNVRREYRHLVRAMVHRLVNTGSFEIVQQVTDNGSQSTQGTREQLHGMLGFIDQLDRYNRDIQKRVDKIKDGGKLSTKESMYRRFLLFTALYAAPKSVIVCEGATDNVYLLHAIRSLAEAYPKLVAVEPDGGKKLKVRILKYASSGTGRILGIYGGGASNLKNLIHNYRKEKERFKAPGLVHPVVLLVDNDTGAKAVYDAIGQITKQKPTGKEDFIHVTGNMYVVPTPYDKSKTSVIEDCFNSATKSVLVDGKEFHPGDDLDPDSHYGKMVFAHKVVAKNADTIDFSGFKAILDRIVAVIEAHESKNANAQSVKGLAAP